RRAPRAARHARPAGDAVVGRSAGLVLALVFLATGYALLEPLLRGSGARRRVSFAGIALLVGAAVSGVVLCVLVTVGVRPTLAAVARRHLVLLAPEGAAAPEPPARPAALLAERAVRLLRAERQPALVVDRARARREALGEPRPPRDQRPPVVLRRGVLRGGRP